LILGHASSEAFERGDVDGAIAIQRRAVARDPLNQVIRNNLAVILLADDRLDEAMSEYRKVLELSPDVGLNVEVEIVRILVLQRRYDEARSVLARFPEGKYRDHGLALLYLAPGGQAEADAALARLIARPDDRDNYETDIVDRIKLAEVQTFRGMNDAALESLKEKRIALERNWGSESPVVWYFTLELKVSPFLKALHADPRWTALTTFAD
jgi:tetratricopeptide (TPR) repeat protein